MGIHDIVRLKVSEDADVTTTTSSDIAQLPFPLFGPKKAIRRAVDPMGYTTPKKKKKKKDLSPYPKKIKDILPKKS